jgi:hypothetical protein
MLMRARGLVSLAGVWLCAVLGGLVLWSGVAAADGGFALPDGRQWEMVSPPNKHGASVEPIVGVSGQGALTQAAEGGGAITYYALTPDEPGPSGNPAPWPSQILSRRGATGWSSQDIATPHESVVEITGGHSLAEYMAFSPDLSVGLLEPKGETPLPPLPANAERTIYLRDDATGGYLPLVTAANVRPGAKLGDEFHAQDIIFEGASPDLSHVAFTSREALTANAFRAGLGVENLYEWAGGQLQLVSILPPNTEGKEKPAAEEGYSAELGSIERPRVVSHAVSADGSRVIWQGEGRSFDHIYMRDTTRGETVQIDAPGPGAVGGEDYPLFKLASADGSRVLFTDGARLTTDSKAGGRFSPDLYVFEVSGGSGRLSGTLRDLTPEGLAGESARVLGPTSNGEEGLPLGASEDASYIYFVAEGALATGAVAGSPNLYVDHYGGAGWEGSRLVAVLSGDDLPDWDWRSVTARVSPSGRFLAFMSDRSLTGYDNRDAVSGVPDEEVYLYDADAGPSGAGRVVCVSCDPSGARPTGVYDRSEQEPGGRLLVDHIGRGWPGRWLDGSVPGWTGLNEELQYQARYLSDGGRLFFDSSSALVSGDVNGKEDAYEYEAAGVGGCEEAARSTDVVFSRAAAGCVGLISSGTSSEESAFMDASATGGEVFFLTSAQLSPQDVDGAFDVYDARECTSESPCMGGSTGVVSLPCAGAEACRGAGSAPSVFGAPVTAGITGAGNISPPPPGAPVQGRSLSRAQKLARALKACRREPKRKRAACEARARRAYRATTARAGASSARPGR